jgi:SAM-dependent methyltransferase
MIARQAERSRLGIDTDSSSAILRFRKVRERTILSRTIIASEESTMSTTTLPTPATLPAPVTLLRMLAGFEVTAALTTVASLGVADHLADDASNGSPSTDVASLAGAVGADADALYRVLRMLASVGVFTEIAPGRFANTPVSECLRADAPGSMRAMVLLWGREHYRAFGDLEHSVRTATPAFDHVAGTTWWQYLSREPATGAVFDQAMTNLSRQVHAAAVGSLDLTSAQHVVDVGGGHGALLATLLTRYPELRGTLYDVPVVADGARKAIAEAGLTDRVDVIGGDFFEAVPPGGDVYVLSMVVHDWPDDAAVRILRNVREVLPENGQVLVVDAVLPDGDDPHFGKFLDLVMLAMLGGRERSAREFGALFERAGLSVERIVETGGPTGVVVGRKA